jgi:NAD-dependent dihydropyrimidine dehydrogenase PreA subunit
MACVTVNWNRCSGKGTCVDVCPASVFDLQELAEHPETLKAVPVRGEDCVLCMECIAQRVEQAINVEVKDSTRSTPQ